MLCSCGNYSDTGGTFCFGRGGGFSFYFRSEGGATDCSGADAVF